MKKVYLSFLSLLIGTGIAFSQTNLAFDVEVETNWENPTTIVVPSSPLKTQIIFVGGVDKVQTTATYGNEAGQALAKQWHDFIGFTPDPDSEDLGWVSVNHEMVVANDSIGDGGGMTIFKIRRNPITDAIEIVEQTLEDGRKGKFFNVDFANTVGETGMNCGGIVGPDGRIWTAEEWFRYSNQDIAVLRDQNDFTINTDIPGDFNGATIEKYQNFNYMVEIDPKQAKAIRKQYNWGRQPFEGGVIMADNKTVYLGADDTPALLTKFVADVAGDFTKGKLYAYKHDKEGDPWIEIDNSKLDNMLNFAKVALSQGASMFNRLEWAASYGNKVYFAETGRDGVGTKFINGVKAGGVLSPHIISAAKARHPELANKTDEQVIDFVVNGGFNDYYGRVIELDHTTGVVRSYLEGGPFLDASPEVANYPQKHLSNPDGLNVMEVNGKGYLFVMEDLNGESKGRMPAGFTDAICEMYMLDLSIANPTIDDLVRISVTPIGAEITGACATPDGKTLFVNSQHPATTNPYPYNNSLTYAITGWDLAVSAITGVEEVELGEGLKVWPNPVSRMLKFNKMIDAAIYDSMGRRMKVFRGQMEIDVADLTAGTYILKTSEGETHKLIIQ